MPVSKFFTNSEPVATIDLLLQKSTLSLRTLRRRMKDCGIVSSYNANASFYTLPIFTKFDSYGLWHYENASFSIQGTLTTTIKHMIDTSPTGYSAAELSDILRVKTNDFLRIMSNKHVVEKIRPFSRNIYVSHNKKIYAKQVANRKQLSSQTISAKLKLPSHKERIMILAEIILTKQLTVNVEDVCRRLNKKGFTLSSGQIDNVVNYYGLKKTR